MKHITTILLLSLALMLSACSSQQNTAPESTASADETAAATDELFGLVYQPDRAADDVPPVQTFLDNVKVGYTTTAELMQLVGSPQAAPLSGPVSCSYITSDGYYVLMYLMYHMENDFAPIRDDIRVGEYYVQSMVVSKKETQPDGSEKWVVVSDQTVQYQTDG